jgi:hypothetical protein
MSCGWCWPRARIDVAALRYATVGGGMGDQLLTILWTFPRIARASAGGRGTGASRVVAERLRQAILRETEDAS